MSLAQLSRRWQWSFRPLWHWKANRLEVLMQTNIERQSCDEVV